MTVLDKWIQDLRHAARSLVRTPGFTLTVVVTLALAIGANAAIFRLVKVVLLQPLAQLEPLARRDHIRPCVSEERQRDDRQT